MATLTLSGIRNLVRSDLNETSTTMLSDAELNTMINDGYKDVANKGLCYEVKASVPNVTALVKIISFAEITALNFGIKITKVEYKSGTTDGGTGMMAILPQAVGHIPINGNSPQYWFQWGEHLVIEPLPDIATYDLYVYMSFTPLAIISSESGTPVLLPIEFHECVYLFTLAFAALKLRRWGDAAMAYNKYIMSVQQKRAEYITRYPDYRSSHELPDNVIMQEQQKGG